MRCVVTLYCITFEQLKTREPQRTTCKTISIFIIRKFKRKERDFPVIIIHRKLRSEKGEFGVCRLR
jgi:hypothetical protein